MDAGKIEYLSVHPKNFYRATSRRPSQRTHETIARKCSTPGSVQRSRSEVHRSVAGAAVLRK